MSYNDLLTALTEHFALLDRYFAYVATLGGVDPDTAAITGQVRTASAQILTAVEGAVAAPGGEEPLPDVDVPVPGDVFPEIPTPDAPAPE